MNIDVIPPLSEVQIRALVEVLIFLLNASETECRCNTVANPCLRCRIKAALRFAGLAASIKEAAT